jgi:hypothetical protein
MLGNRRVNEFPMTNVSNFYKVRVLATIYNYRAVRLSGKYDIIYLNKFLCKQNNCFCINM